MEKVKIGIIGCGVISRKYMNSIIEGCDNLAVTACSDLFIEQAHKLAQEFNIPKVYSVEEMLLDSEIELIVNLTIPSSHAEVCMAALNAGKHVYVEKPLALELADGIMVLAKAKEKGLLVGGAPDTFLGAGMQTCKKIIDDGLLGTPAVALGFMISGGPESWHPNPDFLYKKGAGPLFDMAPYYITALVAMLGPIVRVCGTAQITYPERTIASQPRCGEKIAVEVATNVIGVLDFECGAVATLITSFDANGYTPSLQMFGSQGSMILSDPNTFEGPVLYKKNGSEEWTQMPLVNDYTGEHRGIGVADMAKAIRSGIKHQANGAMAYHVLEIMHGILESSENGVHYNIKSRF